jgi:hypothetical protein
MADLLSFILIDKCIHFTQKHLLSTTFYSNNELVHLKELSQVLSCTLSPCFSKNMLLTTSKTARLITAILPPMVETTWSGFWYCTVIGSTVTTIKKSFNLFAPQQPRRAPVMQFETPLVSDLVLC